MSKKTEDEFAEAAGTALLNLARGLWWLLRHPRTLIVLLILLAFGLFGGFDTVIVFAIGLGLTLLVWRLIHRRSFDRGIGNAFRRFWRYERGWSSRTELVGLGKSLKGERITPKLERYSRHEHGESIRVRLLVGQTPHDYENAADSLAHAFGADVCRVTSGEPGRVWLHFQFSDPLAEVVPALPPDAAPDLTALPVGRREDGAVWTLRLVGTHVLIAGVTGAGKGSVAWSLLRALGPCIREGSVEVWGIDPKGGMELGPGARMFARLERSDFAAMADLLDDAVGVMCARAERLSGVARQHRASPDDPMLVVLVDEVANLSAYLPDRKLRERIAQSLSLLLTQGRAVGVNVVAALQDPRKEVLAFRNLFPTKVALRLDEPGQVDMVLGEGARERGALCHQIRESTPGVGYVRVDGIREPVRVRAAYVTDEDIHEMARAFPAPPSRLLESLSRWESAA